MRRFASISFFFLVVLFSVTSFAKYNGNICVPGTSDLNNIGRDWYGVHNVSSSTDAVVWCPIMRRATGSADPEYAGTNLVVQVYDRHTSVNVSCTLTAMDDAGNVYFTNTQTTSGWSWNPMTLTFPTFSEGRNMAVQCTLPRFETGFSHVASLYWGFSL